VAHASNLSHPSGRDQEDGSSKPIQANSSRDPILEKRPTQNRAGGATQIVGHLSSKHEALNSNPNATKKKINGVIFLSAEIRETEIRNLTSWENLSAHKINFFFFCRAGGRTQGLCTASQGSPLIYTPSPRINWPSLVTELKDLAAMLREGFLLSFCFVLRQDLTM
jgi:hypothetical protein